MDAEPEFLRVDPSGVSRRAMEHARDLTEDDRLVGVIAPESFIASLRAEAEAMSLDYGEALRDGLTHAVTIVPAWAAKGLEFDCAVVVEPAEIVGTAHNGLRLLYVALTRVTQRLAVVHSEPLPSVLGVEAELPGADSVVDPLGPGGINVESVGARAGVADELLTRYRSMDDATLWAHTHAATKAFGERLGFDRGSDGAG